MHSPVSAISFTGGGISGVLQKAKPVVTFFSTFSKNLMNALKNTDYNDRAIMVQAPPVKGSADQPNYAIGYDFGFRGSGDVDQPFSFVFDQLGRYRYVPMNAQIYPGFIPDVTDPTGVRKMPLSLSDGVAPQLIKGLLSVVLGSKSNAEKAWAPISYFLTVSPETMFFLKVITLMNSAKKNTQIKNGVAVGRYPSVSDIPYEMMTLIFKLVNSPDIKETTKLNGDIGPEKSYRWSKVVTLSRPSKLLAKFPKFFVDFLNVVKPSINVSEVQEYKDKFSSPISDVQKAFAEVRSVFPYEARLDYIKKVVVGKFDTKLLAPTDSELYEFMIRQIIVERYKGLKLFVTSSILGDTVITDDSGMEDSSVQSTTVDDPTLIFVDVDRMTKYLSSRIPKIKDFITFLLLPEQKKNSSAALNAYLSAINGSIETEFEDLQRMCADLTEARKVMVDAKKKAGGVLSDASPERNTEQKISQMIIDKLDAIQVQESTELGKKSERKTKIPLPAYLDIKFWQTMRIMRQPFKGDRDFLFNDASLSLQMALVQAYAIFFRANDDLSYLENLVKTDPREFILSNQQGDTVQLSGKLIYKQFSDAEKYLLYCDNKVSQYRQTLGKLSADQLKADPQLKELTTNFDNAVILHKNAKAAFRHYLRQFQFDRRMPRSKKVGRVDFGAASTDGLGDVNVVEIPIEDQAVAVVTPEVVDSMVSQQQVTAAKPAIATAPTESSSEASVNVDDPFAAFNDTSTADATASDETAQDSSGDLSDGSTDGSGPGVPPIIDSPFGTSTPPADSSSTKDTLFKVKKDLYGYQRNVNAFIKEEFARLLLRCPTLKKIAEKNLESTVYQMTGMHVADLLQSSAGLESDIKTEEDAAFLPGNDFFSAKVSLAITDGKPSAAEMDALGKDLEEKYGLSDPMNSDENISDDESSFSLDEESIDLGSSDFSNLVEESIVVPGAGSNANAASSVDTSNSSSADAGNSDLAGLFESDSSTSSDGVAFDNQSSDKVSEVPDDQSTQAAVTDVQTGSDSDLAGLFAE